LLLLLPTLLGRAHLLQLFEQLLRRSHPPQAAADSIPPALQVVAVAEEYRPPPLRSRRQR